MEEYKFPILDQAGLFSIQDEPPDPRIFAKANRDMVRRVADAKMMTRFRVLRNQIFDFLAVSSFAEIQKLIHDPSNRAVVSKRGYELIGNMFGIQGNQREILSTVSGYSRTADGVIRYLKSAVLNNFASYIEMTNEIDSISNPVDLLLIVFDARYHKKARFEAKRKLILMMLAGSIDQRERETEIERKFYEFLNFLNEKVWSSRTKIGELEIVNLLSTHDPKDFSCLDVKVVSDAEARKIKRQKGQKLTLLKRRRFQCDEGRDIPIYVSIRKKPPETKVLKLLRKGEENPAVAVDDELGLMAVLNSVADVKSFQKHLTRSALKADSFMTLEEVTDTLTGGLHRSSNIGSSSQTQMFKFFARMGGMRVEFIIHSNKTYLNYMYQRDISHDEYEIKRVFDSGVAALLFPEDIYRLNMQEIRQNQIRRCRKLIEEG